MKKTLLEGWQSFLQLVRFLTWYGVLVVSIFNLLPIAGKMVEIQYETLNSTIRFFSVIGFFAVVVTWHVVSTRNRWRARA